VRRQTPESPFSHFIATHDAKWDVLIAFVEQQFSEAKPGYRDGVLLIPMTESQAHYFKCGVIEVTPKTTLRATFSARREGEEPYIEVRAKGEKAPAKVVEIVLYRHDVLGNDASTECEWEIVSINARPTEEPEPQTPMAMARNFLGLPGGTPATYSAEDFAKAILYWSRRAMVDA